MTCADLLDMKAALELAVRQHPDLARLLARAHSALVDQIEVRGDHEMHERGRAAAVVQRGTGGPDSWQARPCTPGEVAP